MIKMKQSPNNNHNYMNQFSRSKSAAIGLDMTFPAN